VEHELLKNDALAELQRSAAALGLATEGSASALAKRIFDAYLAGICPEREVCEVMTWCFAGFTHAEVHALAVRVLGLARLSERLNRALEPVMSWAKRRNVTTLVISASPRPIVEAAAAHWDIAPEHIVAGTAALAGERLAPALRGPIPYAETKAELGRAIVGSARWLAAFGDSGFDGHMMLAAEIRVAVRPKPSLQERANEIPGLIALEERDRDS
jgi:phosphoserine phosphatase